MKYLVLLVILFLSCKLKAQSDLLRENMSSVKELMELDTAYSFKGKSISETGDEVFSYTRNRDKGAPLATKHFYFGKDKLCHMYRFILTREAFASNNKAT